MIEIRELDIDKCGEQFGDEAENPFVWLGVMLGQMNRMAEAIEELQEIVGGEDEKNTK